MQLSRLALSAALIASLASLSAQAADGISGASRARDSASAATPKDIDAVTSASIVPEALRQKVKPSRFSMRPGGKRVLFVVGDPQHESAQ